MLHQELGNRLAESATWHSLGYAHHHLGHDREATACFERALRITREMSDRDGEVTILNDLGDALPATPTRPATSGSTWRTYSARQTRRSPIDFGSRLRR
ncbi:tetratricopeptide repeat protein [Micromonospora sp. NPDC002575]|uniref:tetratricopeptide repeat protein n=1 Tax=Micromonospora sp. NPDC002575 TaxID=3364222 RepID=UPI0036908F54